MPKTITILGATGMQGGDIVKALLKEGSWKIRGVTGNVSSNSVEAWTSKASRCTANFHDAE